MSQEDAGPSSLCGLHVVISELQKSPQLNGRVGTCGEYDEEKQRLKVHMLCEGVTEQPETAMPAEQSVCCVYLMKPSCVSRASSEQAADDAEL